MVTRIYISALLAVITVAVSGFAQTPDNRPIDEKAMDGLEPTQKLGERIPLDTRFVDDLGRDVRLGDYFNREKPVLITFNYFNCPQLCSLQLNGLIAGLRDIDLLAGRDFELVTISFDPLEGKSLAKLKKESYVAALGDPKAAQGWHFLTGDIENIRRITRATGFVYKWDDELKAYAHPAMLVFCSSDGVINRYLGGILFEAQPLRLSIVEASQGKLGSLWDSVFLTCYMYDPKAGRYVPFAQGMMRLGGGITVAVVAVALLLFFRFEAVRRRRLVAANVESV